MIPSLLQIPSAVSDSKLHSVLPNNGKGDFQFDRSTGATRINRDGLIEEVGYFSSELVQNGDFSELGSELVTNGDFATDLSGWGISGNSDADHTVTWTSQGARYQSTTTSPALIFFQNVLTSGKTYKFTVDVAYTSGTIKLQTGSGADLFNPTLVEGTNTFYFTASNTQFLFIRSSTNVDVLIDNVSVKQVDPNDRWTLGDGSGNTKWSITDKANYDHSGTSGTYTNRIVQTGLNIKTGKKYKLTFDVTTTSSTSFWIGNDLGTVNYEGGTYRTFYTGSQTAILEVPNNQTTLAFYNNNSDATLDNISLVEVQGDRPRLSYDITNGVVEDKPHLLLENSSTNLVTFSEDFSQSYWIKSGASITSGFVSPDGTNNAYKLVEDSANSRHFINSTGFSTPDTVYSASLFVKANGRNKIAFRENSITGNYASFNLSNGTVIATNGVSASIELMFNGWYRINYQITSGSSYILGIELLSDSYTSGDPFSNPYQGDGSSGILIYGAQVESQSYATSYIPTAGTTITRAAETCNNSKPSVNSTEGVLYAEFSTLDDDTDRKAITMSQGVSQSNRVLLAYESGNVRAFVYTGALQCDFQIAVSSVLNFNKVAFSYKSNNFKLYINGSLVGSDTSGSTFSANTLDRLSFSDGSGINPFYGKVKGLAVYNEALSESQLMQLTGVTASSIYSNFVTRTASFTVEALNEVKKVIDNL